MIIPKKNLNAYFLLGIFNQKRANKESSHFLVPKKKQKTKNLKPKTLKTLNHTRKPLQSIHTIFVLSSQ
jgi:hypothetical protein